MNPSVYLLVGSLAIGVAAYANAEHDSIETLPSGESYRAYARVISVDPIVTRRVTTEPESRCIWVREDQPRYYRDARGHWRHTYRQDRYERRYEHRHRSAAPSIIGGLLGSLVGYQFGGGHGKTALTIAGAIAGASIGNQIAHGNNDDYSSHRVQRCHTTDQSRVVKKNDGYLVTYRYNGETFTKRTSTRPGKRIPVNVRVTPYEE